MNLKFEIVFLALLVLVVFARMLIIKKSSKTKHRNEGVLSLSCSLFIIVFSVCSATVSVYADSSSYKLTNSNANIVSRSNSVLEKSEAENSNGDFVKVSTIFSVKGNGASAEITFNFTEYEKLTESGQTNAVVALSRTEAFQKCLENRDIEHLVNDIRAYSKNETTVLTLSGSDIQPNYGSAYRILRPFHGPIGTLVACIIIALLAIITVMTILDLAYICFDAFREFCEVKIGDSGKKRFIISLDARRAVKKVEESHDGGGTGKILITYGTSRVWMVLVFGVIILYLADGELFKVVPKLMNFVRGLK